MKISRLIGILEAHLLLDGDKQVAVYTFEGPCEPEIAYHDGYGMLLIDDGAYL